MLGKGVTDVHRKKLRHESGIGSHNALTSIHDCIHCSTTKDDCYVNEQDGVVIDNFLDNLVQVAMAVASRKLAAQQLQDEE